MVCRWKIEAVEQGLVRDDGFGRLQTLSVAAAEDIGGDHQLIPTHLGIARDSLRIHIDQIPAQSESVPLAEASRLATGCPLIFMGAVNTSEVNTRTSGRPEGSR